MVDAKLLGAGVRKWLLLPVLAAVCGAGLLLWRLGCFLPRWIVWQEADCFCTAEEGPEQLSLHRKTLRAVSDGSEIWRSAAGQKVQSLLWCDIDHDGAPELLLLVWRWGRFGKSRPFWKTGPDWGWSQHIDIYDWTGKNFRPAWMASDIGLDAAAWQFDEQQRLVITERSGRDVYLPGRQKWIDYQTGKVYAPGWNHIECGTLPIIILVKDGSAIPHIPVAQCTDQMKWDKITWKKYLADEKKAEGLLCLPQDGRLQRMSIP